MKKNALPKVFLKTKKLRLATLAGILAFSNPLNAQTNSSYGDDMFFIVGYQNTTFGIYSLNNNLTSASYNSANGFYSLYSNTSGSSNAAYGFHSLYANTTGSGNSATGIYSLAGNTTGYWNTATGLYSLYSNTTANENTANGYKTLYYNVTGTYNTAVGSQALYTNTASYNTAMGSFGLFNNTTGTQNTANGYQALYTNSSGNYNSAIGYRALYSNTTASEITANGYQALYSNTTGSSNTATGSSSLYTNTTGLGNTANGSKALYSNTTGNFNTATGAGTLYTNSTGSSNTAYGSLALYYSTTTTSNTAIGSQALYLTTTGGSNTAVGSQSLYTNTTGTNNTALGYNADVSTAALSNATAIGNGATVNASNKVRIGNASVTVVEGPVAYTFSDGRFKTNVKEEDVKGLDFIKQLRPVVYNLDTKRITEFWTKNMPDSIRNNYLDQDFSTSTDIRQSGFIAQEVEKAAKDVNYNFNGVHIPENENDNYSIAYSEFVVPLVKGMQEQQKMIEEQKLLIENLLQEVNELKKAQESNARINQTSMIASSMEQNVPNPFSRETIIKFNLVGQIGNAYMVIYDLSGKQIKSIPIDQRGESSITITSDQLPAGRYFYSIIADEKLLDSKTMIVINK